MVGRIDWDVFIDGQDWQLSELKIVLVSKSAAHAVLRAHSRTSIIRATSCSISLWRTAIGASMKFKRR